MITNSVLKIKCLGFVGFFFLQDPQHSENKFNVREVYLHSGLSLLLWLGNGKFQTPGCSWSAYLPTTASTTHFMQFILFPVLAKQPCQKSQVTGRHVLSERRLLYLYCFFTFPTLIPKHSGEEISKAHMKGLFMFIFLRCLFGERGQALGTHQVAVVRTEADSALDLCSKTRQIP